jgi:hypothetical protein
VTGHNGSLKVSVKTPTEKKGLDYKFQGFGKQALNNVF